MRYGEIDQFNYQPSMERKGL